MSAGSIVPAGGSAVSEQFDPDGKLLADFLLAPQRAATMEREARTRLAGAIVDVCWRATPYGETEDGDTYAYIVTKGAMHRLIGAAQGAGISASFRAIPPPAD